MNSTQTSIDIAELNIPGFHHALRQGGISCSDLVRLCLKRIEQFDPTLKSIISVNQDALDQAYERDEETAQLLASNKSFPPLHGIPIILKDNITTKDLPTSAGVSALQTLTTNKDSQVVTLLKDAGAFILAKANLHEFALHGTTTSSLGSQTLNPYDLTRTPGGSSGGTAAALAANFGIVGCGTDTMNSLRSPASACGIVGFRPSKGVISTEGIVPVSETQDVVGPMGRSVGDVRVLFDVMRQFSRQEAEGSRTSPTLRIGVLDVFFRLEEGDINVPEEVISENQMVQGIINQALTTLRSNHDIELVPIPSNRYPNWNITHLLKEADTQPFEFEACLNQFLQSSFLSQTPHRTLESIIQSKDYHTEAVTEVFFAAQQDPKKYSRTSPEYHTRLDRISELKQSVHQCFDENRLDAIVYPHQRQLPVRIGASRQPRRNGILAALTGNPAICIPGE